VFCISLSSNPLRSKTSGRCDWKAHFWSQWIQLQTARNERY